MPARVALWALLLGCSPGLIGAARPQSQPTRVETSVAGAPARSEDLFVAGRFSEATDAYERAVAEDPKSASSAAGLARMRLYQHREDEAAALARQALALSPANELAAQVLKSVDSRRVAFGADGDWAGAPTAAAAVEFVVTDPLPVVPVKVDGRPARFLIDTGAPDVALNPAFAKRLNLPLASAGVGVFAGGRQAPVQRTRASQLEIGGLRFRNVPAVINPAEIPGLKTDGVLGAGVFLHALATLDYCRGRLVLAPRGASAAFEERARASGANIVPMWLVGDHFVFAWAEINGTPGLYSIDTGLAGGGLVATRSTVEAAHIVLDDGKAGDGRGGGGAVRFVPFHADAKLGALSRNNVPGFYMPEGDPYGMFRFKVAGALSHSFFRHSRVTFDFDAMKLVTERCD